MLILFVDEALKCTLGINCYSPTDLPTELIRRHLTVAATLTDEFTDGYIRSVFHTLTDSFTDG
jgi:hypothetical protein